LQWICGNICRNTGLIGERPKCLEGKQVCMFDASTESINGSKKADYRLHYMIELFQLKLIEMHLTEAKEGEKLSRFENIGKNDIIMADRAYGTVKGVEYALEKGADYIFRLKAKSFNLYNEEGKPVKLEDYFIGLKENESADINVYYKADKQVKPIRICGIRKTEEAEMKGLKQIKKSNN